LLPLALSQWVLADYSSERLDLSDPKVFRDLSKPMGALTEPRLSEARERYATFEDPSGSTPAFHYGSHYSTMAGTVLYFLVRVEPFTSLHIEMQDGHLDIPDRLFNSVPKTWKMCTTEMSEVKELTPEFYYLPEFLSNHSNLDLGTAQGGRRVGDVELPPWARGSPELFVRRMRDALESEHVSRHLHLWIDLIFGRKARLPEAEAADNVFYYLTYPGAVDMDAIKDPATRLATELQIKHFGQCPLQIFTRNHPPRGDPPGPPFLLGQLLRGGAPGGGGLDAPRTPELADDEEPVAPPSVSRSTGDVLGLFALDDEAAFEASRAAVPRGGGSGQPTAAPGTPGEALAAPPPHFSGARASVVGQADSGAVLAVRLLDSGRAICVFENGDVCSYVWGRAEQSPEAVAVVLAKQQQQQQQQRLSAAGTTAAPKDKEAHDEPEGVSLMRADAEASAGAPGAQGPAGGAGATVASDAAAQPPPLLLLPSPEALENAGVTSASSEGLSCPPVQRLALKSLRRLLAATERERARSSSNASRSGGSAPPSPRPGAAAAAAAAPSSVSRRPSAKQEGAAQASCVCLAWSRDGKVLVHAGPGIGTMEVLFFDTDSGHLRTWAVTVFADIVDLTSVAVDNSSVVAGSSEGSIRVWDLLDGSSSEEGLAGIAGAGGGWGICAAPRLALTGHRGGAVTAVAACEEQGLVVSATPGCCLVHSLVTGELLGGLVEAGAEDVRLARISVFSGRVVLATERGGLFLYKTSLVSAAPLATVRLQDAAGEPLVLGDAALTRANPSRCAPELLLHPGGPGIVVARALDDALQVVATFAVGGAPSSAAAVPLLRAFALNATEEALLCGASDGTLLLQPMPNFVGHGPGAVIPVVGTMDVNAKLAHAKNAVLSKIETARVLATARGVAVEAVGVGTKLLKGLTAVFGGGKTA
jgi:hypothetical protein